MTGMAATELFSVPLADRRFEDFVPGRTYEHGARIRVSADDILRFAREFDLQSLHADPEAAAAGPFGGLIASGWHVTALMTRLLTEHYLPPNAGFGGPGADELRWLRPVRPGDSLCLRLTVVDGSPSPLHPDRGLLQLRPELVNQDHEPVLTMTVLIFLGTRASSEVP